MDVGVLTQLNQPDVKRELSPESLIVNPLKLETGLRPNSAGIPYTLKDRGYWVPNFGFYCKASVSGSYRQQPETCYKKLLHNI